MDRRRTHCRDRSSWCLCLGIPQWELRGPQTSGGSQHKGLDHNLSTSDHHDTGPDDDHPGPDDDHCGPDEDRSGPKDGDNHASTPASASGAAGTDWSADV